MGAAATDAEQLLERELGRYAILVERERVFVPTLLVSEERILFATITGLMARRVGVVVVTDRRVLQVYFRKLWRRMRVTEVDYLNVESVHGEGSRSLARVRLRLKFPQRVLLLRRGAVNFPLGLPGHGLDEAKEMANHIRKAVDNVQDGSTQAGRPPWRAIGP